MKFLKSFNENSGNLFPNIERIFEITSFNGQTLSYWLGYTDADGRNVSDIDSARRMSNHVIEDYEGNEEDGGAPAKNRDMLLDEMLALAKIMISFRGSCNKGVLQAYCAQNMDIVEWAKSDKLKDMNKKTGLFESVNFENNEECGFAQLREDILNDHMIFIDKLNEYLKPRNFKIDFINIINGKLGGHYIYVRINNVGMVFEGYDHMRPHKNSVEVWEIFKNNGSSVFYNMEEFITFYKQHNLHLYDLGISKTGIFNK